MDIKTENNSIEMNTIVETFIIEETVELIYDNEKLEKWNNLVSELGLKGQTKIVHPEKSPIPFMPLKTGLKNIFECLCPAKVDIKEYDITPIPVEILDLIALSSKEKYFSEIQIWYDDHKPDPCCIGIIKTYGIDDQKGHRVDDNLSFKFKQDALDYIKNNNLINHTPYDYSYSNPKFYLLGKWADVKHSFDELKEMAIKRFIEDKKNELQKVITEAKQGLDNLETKAFEQFN